MKRFQMSTMVCALAVAIPLAAWATPAPGCLPGCAGEIKACVQTARTTLTTCRLDCRQNASAADRGSCMRACSGAFRTSRASCTSDAGTCVASCGTPADAAAPACLGGCGQALAACARGVVTAAHVCVAGCRTADDRLGCLRGCVADAKAAAAGCADDFTACRGDCGGPTTTTTLPSPLSCESAEAPACGGTCPTAEQSCRPVGPNGCACVAGSAGGAFVR